MIDFAFSPEDIPEGFDFESLFADGLLDTDFDAIQEIDIEIHEHSEVSGENGSQESSEDRNPEIPTLKLEIWANRSPDNQNVYLFWIVVAFGTTRHECVNEGQPYYTEEIVLQKAIEAASKKNMTLNTRIFFLD